MRSTTVKLWLFEIIVWPSVRLELYAVSRTKQEISISATYKFRSSKGFLQAGIFYQHVNGARRVVLSELRRISVEVDGRQQMEVKNKTKEAGNLMACLKI